MTGQTEAVQGVACTSTWPRGVMELSWGRRKVFQAPYSDFSVLSWLPAFLLPGVPEVTGQCP